MKKNIVRKKIAILIILIIIVSLMPITSVFGATHTLLRSSSATLGSLLEVVKQGTITSEEYAFSLKANKNTYLEMWGYSGKILDYDSGNFKLKLIMPTDPSLSGKIGCYIYNCGNYQGKNVNLKCTFIWKEVKDGNGKMIYPIIMPTVEYSVEKVGFNFVTLGYGVIIELIDDNGNPINVNMSMSIGDIDYYQYFGVRVDEGNINKIQCRTDCKVYYRFHEDYHFLYAGSAKSNDGLEAAVKVELKNTNKFTLWMGCDYDNYSWKDLERYKKSSATDYYLETKVSNVQSCLDSGVYNASKIGGGWGCIDGTVFGPYEVVTPIKYISDSNESKVMTNTLISDGEEVCYDIYQYVPSESSSYYYTLFIIEDKLPDCLTYVSAKVYDNSNSDVTSNFAIDTSGNTITATAKNTSVSDFYNNTYNLRIYAKFNKEIIDNANSGYNWLYDSNTGTVNIKNTATVTVKRGTDTVTKISDEVNSNYYYKIVEGKKIWADNNNALGLRPENYTVKLYSDGTYLKQTEFTDTNWSFEKLPKYDSTTGKEILYTISEDEILLSNGDKYLPSISGTTITNTLTGTVNIDVTKVWEDDENANNTRPEDITVIINAN